LAADAVLVVHFAFIVFVVGGALLAFRFSWMPWLHLPAAAWGIWVEIAGRICPLTTLENDLRLRAGLTGYKDSFIEHYLFPVIYPSGLTRGMQLAIAAIVIVTNTALYFLLLRRRRKTRFN
jgi:hypothetical protein